MLLVVPGLFEHSNLDEYKGNQKTIKQSFYSNTFQWEEWLNSSFNKLAMVSGLRCLGALKEPTLFAVWLATTVKRHNRDTTTTRGTGKKETNLLQADRQAVMIDEKGHSRRSEVV